MTAVRNLVAFTATSALMVLVGCATTGGSLTSSADRLAQNADALARDTRDDSAARDARELADQADEFRRTIYDERADDRDVHAAFERLSRDYHSLRDEIDRSDSRDTRIDMRAVTEAYLDVERAMSSRAYTRRYAEDRDYDRRDRPDRY